MSKSSIKEIKQLREVTGAGVMDVKRALQEAGGDPGKAKKLIEEKGIAKAASKSEREVKAGLVHAYIHGNGKVGALVEVNCETDFVARTEVFQELAHNLAMQVAAMEPEAMEDLLAQDCIKDAGVKVGDLVKSVIAKTGENVVVARFVRYALGHTK